jgi:hypothetical protein
MTTKFDLRVFARCYIAWAKTQPGPDGKGKRRNIKTVMEKFAANPELLRRARQFPELKEAYFRATKLTNKV